MHALSVETVFAIYHLTFPWLKAGSIMCGSSSNQHFHQSSFQKNMSIRKARWCRAEGEKEDREENQQPPQCTWEHSQSCRFVPQVCLLCHCKTISKSHLFVIILPSMRHDILHTCCS